MRDARPGPSLGSSCRNLRPASGFQSDVMHCENHPTQTSKTLDVWVRPERQRFVPERETKLWKFELVGKKNTETLE